MHGVKSGVQSHLFRRTDAQIDDLSDASDHTMQHMGHLGRPPVMERLHSMQISPEDVLVAGGWHEEFYHPRFMILLTPSIIHCIFPFLDTLKKDIEKRKKEGEECISQNNVAGMLDYLAIVVFQGALHLIFTGECQSGGACNPWLMKLDEKATVFRSACSNIEFCTLWG